MGTTNIYLTTSEGLGTTGTGATSRAGAVEVHEFDVEIQQVGSEVGGKPRSVEAVVPGAFKVKKAIDGTSPLWFRWCCIGEYISSVTISCYATVPDTPYAVFKMSGVHVTGYKPSSSGGLPTEELTFKYGKLSVKYNGAGLGSETEFGNTSGATNVEKAWSWVVELPV
jgi:type VI secretion system Hcp family effector